MIEFNTAFIGEQDKNWGQITHRPRILDQEIKLFLVNKQTGQTVMFNRKKPEVNGFYKVNGKPLTNLEGSQYVVGFPPLIQAERSTILSIGLWHLYNNWDDVLKTFLGKPDLKVVKTIIENLSPITAMMLNALPCDQISTELDSALSTRTGSLKSHIKNHGCIKCRILC